MQVGDLVIRKTKDLSGWKMKEAVKQREMQGFGIVIGLYQHRFEHGPCTPAEYPCLTIYYPKTGQIYDIAESLMRKL